MRLSKKDTGRNVVMECVGTMELFTATYDLKYRIVGLPICKVDARNRQVFLNHHKSCPDFEV